MALATLVGGLLVSTFAAQVCAQHVTVVNPAAQGMSRAALEKFQRLARKEIDEGRLPGIAVIVSRHGQICYFDCYGHRDIEGELPLTPDTIYRIYSMTKPLTTVAALILYDEERFALDDPVERFIPSLADVRVYDADAADGSQRVAMRRSITIRDLLRHTSGWTYGYSSDDPVDRLYHEARILDRRGTTLADLIDKLARLPLRYQPGERWHYGVSTDVLGSVIEVISGKPLDQFCSERIWAPLQMSDTGFDLPLAKRKRLAAIYARDAQGSLTRWGGEWETEAYLAPTTFYSGGGGGVSTILDYHRFAQMLINGGRLGSVRVLSKGAVELMTTNQLPGEFRPGWGYGFGVQVCTDVERSNEPGSVGSFGWGGGGNTFFFVDPQEDLIAMVWTQLSGKTTISREFRAAVYRALASQAQADASLSE